MSSSAQTRTAIASRNFKVGFPFLRPRRTDLLALGDDLPGRPTAEYKRRIGPWILWRAGPAKHGDARYWAAHSDDLTRAFTLRLFPDGSAQGAGPSVERHDRFRAWKEDLRDHD